jgi:acetyltransferase
MRPVRADDLQREKEFVGRLSPDSRYERFMVTVNELPQSKLRYLTDVDQLRHVALAATTETGGREDFVGIARYIVDADGGGAEFAIAVADDWQGTGLAGVLMHALLRLARARGVRTMEAFVLATNARMLKFARQLGFAAERRADDRDTVRVLRAL